MASGLNLSVLLLLKSGGVKDGIRTGLFFGPSAEVRLAVC